MKTQGQILPQELAAALADLRQIRETVDTTRANHPMRLVARPLLSFSISLGLIVVAFGVIAQLVLDYEVSVLDLSPSAFVWALGVLLAVKAQLVKLVVIDMAGRRAGYDLMAVLRAVFTIDYAQIVLPGALLITLGSLALGRLGGHEMILGFVIAGAGALLIPLGRAIALPEWGVLGALLFVLGAIAMFTFPEWPFYKLAVSWGGTLILGGLVLRPRFPALPR